MPGGRGRFGGDPGLPGGARARYLGEDAYQNQQRENETRIPDNANGRFFAPIWTSQTPPGGGSEWFMNHDTGAADQAIPQIVANNSHEELHSRNWINSTLEYVTFSSVGNTFSGYVVVVEPGWWTFNIQAKLTAGGVLTRAYLLLYLTPMRTYQATGSATTNALLFQGHNAAYAATIAEPMLNITIPVPERSMVLVDYFANTAPTLEAAGVISTTSLLIPSFVSGRQA